MVARERAFLQSRDNHRNLHDQLRRARCSLVPVAAPACDAVRCPVPCYAAIASNVHRAGTCNMLSWPPKQQTAPDASATRDCRGELDGVNAQYEKNAGAADAALQSAQGWE